MRLVLLEPDIPQNTGTILRLAACLGMGLDIIEPCGFVLDDRRLRRAAMDYIDHLDWQRWPGWTTYNQTPQPGRLILLSAHASTPYTAFGFAAQDRLLLGRESSGVPGHVRAAADAAVTIPMAGPHIRSLNVAMAAAMVAGEAARQTVWTQPASRAEQDIAIDPRPG